MSRPIIEVRGISKRYQLNANKEKYLSLRDELAKRFAFVDKKKVQDTLAFWALNDVNFTIEAGEAVGIIGRNGAGKSTLLKILSQITPPTQGEVVMRGRVASLLEVGTGFHPELSGRENIYLNGAILGMTRREIALKFDEIVAFAGVEKFLDTPVKRYSSGMYVRLAFAVAAHLEPEILIIDEVLAVGDAEFQKKCLGKMNEVAKGGRTVLFVSHNMSAVESLCTRGIVLQAGVVSADAAAPEAIKCYLDQSYAMIKSQSLESRIDRKGTGRIRITRFQMLNKSGQPVASLQSGKTYSFSFDYRNYTNQILDNVVISFDIFDDRNARLMQLRSSFYNANQILLETTGSISCKVNDLFLANGTYRVSLFLSHAEGEILDWVDDASSITVDGGDFFGTGSHGMPSHCSILTHASWSAD